MFTKKNIVGIKKMIILFSLIFILTSCWEEKNNKKHMPTNSEETIMQSFPEENFVQIGVSDFKKKLENPEVILIDVRTPGELPVYWKIRENQLLININDGSFSSKIAKLDKSKKYVLYCWHWNRTRTAREYMKKQGFSYVKDLKWWIEEWVNSWESVIK